MFDTIRSFFRSPPKQRGSGLGAGLSDQDDDRFPTFQNAWKQGATFEDMFGDQPFQLHGSVGGSGADNHRPDVAKVETFLGDAGFYKPMTSDGPTGWHNTNLDQGIKAFQKAHGLKVDGLLKPNGPTITTIGGLLGGGQAQPPAPKPAPKPEIANPIPAVPQSPWARPRPAAAQRDPFSGHAIAPDGAEAHDRYAQALVNDSDPSKTAAFLNNVIGWEGDRGRGDVADLLGRFQKVDPDKARDLQDQLFKLTGQRIPFRIAPVQEGVGGPMADLEDPAPVRLPKANPWGGTEGANTWEAGNMAKVLLERTDYKDAVKHFADEFKRDPDGTKPYTAAVYQAMAAKSPAQALQFIKQMADGGLARMAEEAPPEESGEETDPPETPVPDPTPPKPEPGPEDPEEQPEDKPDDKPEDEGEKEKPEDDEEKQRKCNSLNAKWKNAELQIQTTERLITEQEQQLSDVEAKIDQVVAELVSMGIDAAAGCVSGGLTGGTIGCLRDLARNAAGHIPGVYDAISALDEVEELNGIVQSTIDGFRADIEQQREIILEAQSEMEQMGCS